MTVARNPRRRCRAAAVLLAILAALAHVLACAHGAAASADAIAQAPAVGPVAPVVTADLREAEPPAESAEGHSAPCTGHHTPGHVPCDGADAACRSLEPATAAVPAVAAPADHAASGQAAERPPVIAPANVEPPPADEPGRARAVLGVWRT